MWFKLASATFSTHLGSMASLSNSISIKYTANGFSYTTTSVTKTASSASLVLNLMNGWTCASTPTVSVTGAAKVSGTPTWSSNKLTIAIVPSSGSNFAAGGSVINVSVSGAVASTPSGGGNTSTNYTFTINPTPTSATVTLSATGYSTVSGTGSKSITVANGITVNWSVSTDGYTTRTGSWTADGENKTESIVLIAAGNSGERVVIAEKADYSLTGFCRPTNGSFGGTTDTSYKRTDYIDITAYSTLYAYCQPRATSVSPISFFNAEKVWISGITPDSETVTQQQEFTADVPENAVYAIFSGFSNSNPLKAEGMLK